MHNKFISILAIGALLSCSFSNREKPKSEIIPEVRIPHTRLLTAIRYYPSYNFVLVNDKLSIKNDITRYEKTSIGETLIIENKKYSLTPAVWNKIEEHTNEMRASRYVKIWRENLYIGGQKIILPDYNIVEVQDAFFYEEGILVIGKLTRSGIYKSFVSAVYVNLHNNNVSIAPITTAFSYLHFQYIDLLDFK